MRLETSRTTLRFNVVLLTVAIVDALEKSDLIWFDLIFTLRNESVRS